MSDRVTPRRDRTMPCPRCKTPMKTVLNIQPRVGEPGLIGYECPMCGYVKSDLFWPDEKR
jgi:RNase P subunit RPR2